MAITNPDAAQIISYCEARWDANKHDCSGFARAVAADLGITLQGQANAIIDALDAADGWRSLGSDGRQAAQLADQGYFVIAGLKATAHGHVAVVVSAPPQAYPVGYWGRFGGVGQKNKGLNWSWNPTDLPNVKYWATKP